jgi:hypothetical protein
MVIRLGVQEVMSAPVTIEAAGKPQNSSVRRRAVIAAAAGTWLAACQPTNNRKGTPMYKLQDAAGPHIDMNSEYARNWPGEAALFKLREGLTLAIPPMYQEFWLQGDKVMRRPAPKERAPEVERVGFDFFLPDFGGYTPDNYRQPFHQDRVEVVSLQAVEPRTDGRPPTYSDVDGAISRLTGIELVPDQFEDVHGLRCFAGPVPANSRRTCVGERLQGERMLLQILVPPYAPGITNPIMQTTYHTKLYGGLQVTWRAHMKHFARWLEIEQQIWKFVDAWNVAK